MRSLSLLCQAGVSKPFLVVAGSPCPAQPWGGGSWLVSVAPEPASLPHV